MLSSLSRAPARVVRASARRVAVATYAPRRYSSASGNAPPASELAVGEFEGVKFRIEPLRRTGEETNTKRARLIYQSRKRGCLESDLILSTFASKHLPSLNDAQLDQYDLLLDENDWDIYYWATQPQPGAFPSADPSLNLESQPMASEPLPKEDSLAREPPSGEWPQTVGTFRPAHRPVPARWRDSEILAMIRAHVKSRSAETGGEGGGMAFMPSLETTSSS